MAQVAQAVKLLAERADQCPLRLAIKARLETVHNPQSHLIAVKILKIGVTCPEVGKLESPGERGGKAIGEPQEHVRAGEERMGVWRYAWGKILMPDLGTDEDSRGNCIGATNYDGEGIIA